VTIGVKCHALIGRIGGRCTEVRRSNITTPSVTLFVTIISVTRNEEAGVERRITDQQLVGVSAVHGSHATPQSMSASSLPIVTCGRNGRLGTSFEVHLVSSLVINEDDFSELKQVGKEKRLVCSLVLTWALQSVFCGKGSALRKN